MSSMAGVLYETGTIYPSPEFTNVFLVGSVLLIFLDFCVVLLCVFMFWVPCYDICYDFHIKKMFGSFLPPVICRRAHVLFMLFVYSGVQHILCCVFVLFFFVLCTQCCQFLSIVRFCLPLRYSLTFILNNNSSTIEKIIIKFGWFSKDIVLLFY